MHTARHCISHFAQNTNDAKLLLLRLCPSIMNRDLPFVKLQCRRCLERKEK